MKIARLKKIKLNELNIGKRLGYLFGVIGLLFVINMTFNTIGSYLIEKENEIMYHQCLKGATQLIEGDRDAYQSNLALCLALEYASTNHSDKINAELESCKSNLIQVNEERYLAFKNIFSKDGIFIFSEQDSIYNSAFKELSAVTYEVIQLIEENRIEKADELYHSQYDQHFSTMRDQLDILTEKTLALASEQNASISNITVFVRTLSIVIFLIVLFILIGGAMMVTRSITRPLSQAVEHTQNISEGKLYMDIIPEGKDEISKVQDSMSHMIESLRDIVSKIREKSNDLNYTSKQFNETSQQIASGANEQAASTEQISASMEEISASTRQNTENARMTEGIALKVSGELATVSQAVSETVKTMQEIVDKISIIDEIAERTDLLAVNAAIEAARAGEFGKGFAVVANEVRKLAENSQTAAKEIDSISKSSVETALRSGQMLQDLVPQINRTTNLIQEIAAASTEQDAGITQVNTAIAELSKITQSNSASAEEMAASSNELQDHTKEMADSIRFFLLSEDSNSQLEVLKDEASKLLQKIASMESAPTEHKAQSKTEKSKGKTTPRKEDSGKETVKINMETNDEFESF